MRKNNLVDFSNVYSPKSQNLLAKGRQILTQLNTSKLSPRSPSRPKSPLSRKQFVTNIPETESYQQHNKVILTEERVRQIHDRLAIDTRTERGFELRMRTDKMYFKANSNPFTREFQLNDEEESQRKPAERNILAEMGRLRDTNQQITPRRLAYMPTPVKELCAQFKKEREKKLQPHLPPTREKESKEVHKEEGTKQEHTKSAFEELDELIGQKEVNFFQNHYGNSEKNIFLLIKDRNHPKFRSNKEILDVLYFNNDSMVIINHQKQKYRVNYLQEISSFARLLIKGLKPKNMPDKMVISEGDLNPYLDKLLLQDMMLISSGKLASSILLRYFREEEEETGRKKVVDDQQPKGQQKHQVIYSEHLRNRRTDFNPVDQDKNEIEYYGRSEYTKLEEQQQIISKTLQGKLKRVIQQQIESLGCTIRDKKVIDRFREQKNKTLLQMLNSNVDKRVALLMKEVERKIRMNKMNKNRTEKVKVDILTQSFKMKKRMEGGTKSKSKSKSSRESSFSPLKTWRN